MRKNEKKETIFDFNPTDEELIRFGGKESFEKDKEYGIDIFANDDNRFYCLGLLFAIRNDRKKSKEYFSKIKDKTMLATLVQDF